MDLRLFITTVLHYSVLCVPETSCKIYILNYFNNYVQLYILVTQLHCHSDKYGHNNIEELNTNFKCVYHGSMY